MFEKYKNLVVLLWEYEFHDPSRAEKLELKKLIDKLQEELEKDLEQSDDY